LDLYIASAKPEVIRKAIHLGAVGVATNPSVVAEVGQPWRKVLKNAAEAFDGPFLVQAVARDVAGIRRQAGEFHKIVGDRLIVKVPMSPIAISAMRELHREGFVVMITTIVTLAQGLVAAQAGADQLGVYVGRAERAGIDPYALIRGLRQVIDRRGLATKIGVGSINDIPALVGSALAGADHAAPVFDVLRDAIAHDVTERGLVRFEDDWNKIPSSADDLIKDVAPVSVT
jgi:transaldolase